VNPPAVPQFTPPASSSVPAGLRPSNFGLKTIAEDPATLGMWNDAMRSAFNSPRPNAYKTYLEALHNGQTPTKKMLDDAWKVVNGNFMESYRTAGNQVHSVHHWNFNRNDFPTQVFDSRNLVPTPTKQVHDAIHAATTSNPTRMFNGPIAPQHQITIPDYSTPLAPRP
jgi:hypothetical protein